MVGANTFRNPGLTAKLATTLDHISDGRAVLGIGGAWFEREHDAFGIDFGAGFGERLDRLDEAVGLIRRLLDGETVDHEGRPTRCTRRRSCPGRSRPTCRSSSAAPGRRRRSAPSPAPGTPGTRPGRSTRSRRAMRSCASTAPTVGRDPRHDRTHDQLPDRHPRPTGRGRGRSSMRCSPTTASPAERGDERARPPRPAGRRSPTRIRPYRDLGFGTVIVRLPAPYDPETIARIGEVRDALDARRSRTAGRAVGRVTVVVLAGGVGGAKLAHGAPGRRRRRADGRRQHRRRRRAPRAAASGPTTTPSCTRWPGSTTASRAGGSAARRRRGRAARALRRGDVVPARRPRPRDAHRPDRPAARRRRGSTEVALDLQRSLGRRRHDPADDRRAGPDRGPDRRRLARVPGVLRPPPPGADGPRGPLRRDRRAHGRRPRCAAALATAPRSSSSRRRTRSCRSARSSPCPACARHSPARARGASRSSRCRRSSAGRALKGPADRMLVVARPRGERPRRRPDCYADLVDVFVLDAADADLAPAIGDARAAHARHRHGHDRRCGPRPAGGEMLAFAEARARH